MDNIPNSFEKGEKLTRIIFSPFHIDKNNRLKPAAFKSPSEKDEVSVTRINYTDAHFCKKEGKKMETPEKIFQGLATISYEKIVELGAFARVSKLEINPFHADIYYGIIIKKGESAPAELNLILKNISQIAMFFKDINPNSETWEGDDITQC
jgi:hypothetical protein